MWGSREIEDEKQIEKEGGKALNVIAKTKLPELQWVVAK